MQVFKAATFRILVAGAVLLTLSACISISSAPAGNFASGSSKVTLGRDWSDISSTMYGRPKQLKLLSIDGPQLNQLYIVDGLPEGAWLVKRVAKEKPTPTVRKGMSARERMEFVSDSIAALGYQSVSTLKPRPAKFGQTDAIRFDLAAKTSTGLDISGTALVAEVGGKLYLILYLAPSEHYFAATLAEVETVMRSARIG